MSGLCGNLQPFHKKEQYKVDGKWKADRLAWVENLRLGYIFEKSSYKGIFTLVQPYLLKWVISIVSLWGENTCTIVIPSHHAFEGKYYTSKIT